MVRCSRCGEIMPERVRFCGFCGNPISEKQTLGHLSEKQVWGYPIAEVSEKEKSRQENTGLLSMATNAINEGKTEEAAEILENLLQKLTSEDPMLTWVYNILGCARICFLTTGSTFNLAIQSSYLCIIQ